MPLLCRRLFLLEPPRSWLGLGVYIGHGFSYSFWATTSIFARHFIGFITTRA